MTRDDIIRMAREAGATPYTNRHYPDRPTHTFNLEQLECFTVRVAQKATEEANRGANASWGLMCEKMVADEREACAKLCDDVPVNSGASDWGCLVDGAERCAEEIRARGQHAP